MQNYSNRVYIHSYCSKIGYLQSYTTTDACVFYAIFCKFLHFLYFRHIDAIALSWYKQVR